MPKIIDHDERRREISTIVLEIISERGVQGVTMREVAERSDWSTGVISHYFKNRDGLLVSALQLAANIEATRYRDDRQNQTGIAALFSILHGSLPVSPVQLAIVKIFLFFYIEGVVDARIEAETREHLREWTKLIEKMLHSAVKNDEICEHLDLVSVADDLAAVTWGMCVHMVVDPEIMRRTDTHRSVANWIRTATTCKSECRVEGVHRRPTVLPA